MISLCINIVINFYVCCFYHLFLVKQEEQLRVALIDYLRKHGNDNDKLQMVALNYNMFRELAKTKEERAKQELASIKPKHLGTYKCNTSTINVHFSLSVFFSL